jgi:hypothetical protein
VANPSCTAAVLPALSSNSRIIACLNMFSTKHEAGTGFVLCILFIYDFFFCWNGIRCGATCTMTSSALATSRSSSTAPVFR